MYRILVADDEPDIREGLANLIAQRATRWEVAAVAENGLDAMEQAKRILPDAILTDICMPHMNGLDFLENLEGELPDTKFVILSGYDQFDYAVQALRIGVWDFLLKPLEESKLLEVLNRLAVELDRQAEHRAKAEEIQTQVKRSNRLRLERYFEAALLGDDLPELDGNLRAYAAGNYYCCVLCDVPQNARELLESLILQRLDARMHMAQAAPECMVFWSGEQSDAQEFFLKLHHILSSAAVHYQKETQERIHFFLGEIVDSLRWLRISHTTGREVKTYVFPEQAATCTTYKDTLEASFATCRQIPETLEKDIVAAVKYGNEHAFFQCCDELMSWIQREGIQNAMYIRMMILNLCNAILRESRNTQELSYYEFINFHKEIMAAGSLAELRIHLESFARVNWLFQKKAHPSHPSLRQRVEAIVEKNLSDIDFSLDVVAGELFISPNYLRQLFKGECGQTFTEFLTAKRMARAKMLLGNPKTRIGDAAEQCGYADPRYFSSCFKKYFHMTPSEYQALVQRPRG